MTFVINVQLRLRRDSEYATLCNDEMHYEWPFHLIGKLRVIFFYLWAKIRRKIIVLNKHLLKFSFK